MYPNDFDKLTVRIKKELVFIFLLNQLKIKTYPGNKIFSVYKDETEPSLVFYPDTNWYWCYSTKQGGDIIKFYRAVRNVGFRQAVQELFNILNKQEAQCGSFLLNNTPYKQECKKAKKEIKNLRQGEYRIFNIIKKILLKKGVAQEVVEIETLKKIYSRRLRLLDKIIKFTIHNFKECSLSKEALDYLTGKNRKLKKLTIKKFGILYIENPWQYAAFLKNNFMLDELIQSGLFNEKGNYVFFGHKILIPYTNNGKITYLRGRRFPDNLNISKYIGLSGLSAKQIFNVDQLNKVKEGDKLYLCEGEFDTMIAKQIGLNAIGFGGVTNIPFDELKKLNIKKYDLHLIFDNDDAGNKAAKLFADEMNITVKHVKLKDCKDLTEGYNVK